MSTLGERVKTERETRGWSQAELARRVTRAGYSITQGGIAQIERRGETEPKSIVQLAEALGLSVTWLQSNRGERALPLERAGEDQLELPVRSLRRPPADPVLPRTAARTGVTLSGPLQVFGSAEGGTEGAMALSNEPVAWLPR